MKMRKLILSLLLVAIGFYGFSQVTTSAINGKVVDNNGEAVPFANVVALHVPSGSVYGSTTRDDGSFIVQNIRSGGPYTITFSFMGYKTVVINDVYLSLGETKDYNILLQDEGVALDEVIVYGITDNTFNSSRTGANTNISQENIQTLPSISRSIYDYARLTPQATVFGSGISFAGSNNRYNSFQIDGTVNNDVFGLAASGTNGGQASTQPISLDAIDEIQVVIAPFDVKQGGFTGGGINAITKRGSNTFAGTAYFFGNNQSIVGKTPTDDPNFVRLPLDDFSESQMGISLSGPIVKNKVFFFLNAELADRNSPTTNNIGEGSEITLAEATAVETKLVEIFGNNQGGFAKRDRLTGSTKLLGRVDWNINKDHKLTLRHSYVNGTFDNLSRGARQLVFNEAGYVMANITNSSVLELHSKLSNSLSNELRVGYTTVRDNREIMGERTPYIRIDLDANRFIETGTEQFSTANYLNQDIFTITNNVSWFSNGHTFTIGTHNEFFKFENLFIRQNFGAYRYFSLADFLAIGTAGEVLPRSYDYSFSDESVTGSKNWAPVFGAMQLGFYIQDEYRVSNRLKLTAGLRVDIPIFNDQPSANDAFNNNAIFDKWDVATDQMPKTRLMWSPRVGFNWDASGDRSTQVRGGVGVFTGRVPFVWVSNQFSNTGIEYKRSAFLRNTPIVNGNFPGGFLFESNPDNQPVGPAQTSEINVIDPNFKFPQIFRASLAIDQKLPFGVKGTIEGLYSHKLNDIDYKNINREEAGTIAVGPDQRPFYSNNLTGAYTSVIYLTNTSEGYSYNITGLLEKNFVFGLDLTLGYTYGISKDVNSGSSSQAFSNWRFNEQVNGSNSPELSFTDFDIRHRIVGGAIYKVKFAGKFSSSVGLYYNGQSGANYSYIYNGDINRDGQFGNDLVFVPTDDQIDAWLANGQIDAITGANPFTPAEQAVALKDFLNREPYLKTRRGKYAERNGARAPFVNLFDVRFVQDFNVLVGGQKNTVQISFDIMNLGNLLNQEWGRVYTGGFNYSLLNYRGLTGAGAPRYQFTPINGDVWRISDFASRWRGQIGIRYIFN
jgi:hypothetical protein